METDDIIKQLELINRRRHALMVELDNLDKNKNNLTELLKMPKNKRLQTIERQKEFNEMLV